MQAYVYGQKLTANSICKKCGKAIVYGINGAQISEYCTDCKPITYHCQPRPVKNEVSWDELDALEDRCLGDTED